MERILSAASLPASVIPMVSHIIDTCRSCRMWAKPKPDITPTIELVSKQNEEVEADVMFFEVLSIWHIVDRTGRWRVGRSITGKTSETLQEAIDLTWLQVFGSFKGLIIDGEGGVDRTSTKAFLARNGIELVIKAKASMLVR